MHSLPRTTLLPSLILFFFASTSGALTKLSTQPADGHLEFLAIGRPAMIRIKGESSGPRGTLEIKDQMLSGQMTLTLEGLNTGIEMRDRHMKEKYLEIAKFPEAVLIIQDSPLTNPEKSQDVPFKGTLQFHGKTQPMSGVVSYKPESKNKSAHAEFKIRLSDYNIEIPSYAGIHVADEVQIKVDLKLMAEPL